MTDLKQINIEDFTYELPDNRIALYPLDQRDQSKLLIYNTDLKQDNFYNISKYLPDNHLIIFNNTKVIQARILFKKESGATIEIFCLEPYEPTDYNLIFQKKQQCKWKCIVGNSKKWKQGKIISNFLIDGIEYKLEAERIEKNATESIIEFTWECDYTFGNILENIGKTPIPPYIKRAAEELDKERYQTIYSKYKGSVAAPTAGLHFTNDLLKKLRQKNIKTDEVTLHVGAGTFQPVKSENIGGHEMHTEHFSVNMSTIDNLINYEDRIISVGTTSVRTLESIYWLGIRIKRGIIEDLPLITQWEPYKNEMDISVKDSLLAIKNYIVENKKDSIEALTQIIIIPGYEYRVTNHLITNFHQPRSTLLLLVAAAIGNKWKDVYSYALNNDFRFLSYGDSCLFKNINKKSRN
jgi:S-adenosylmethionine:tRNA ribosyltransferase-isomerase